MNLIKVASGILFPLITFPYTSRVLGPIGVGKLNFATSFVSNFILLASIGIPLYGIREVAKVRHNTEALIKLTRELIILHGIATLFTYLSFLSVLEIVSKLNAETALFLIVSFSIPLSVLTLDWLFQGLERYTFITIRSILFSILSIASLFIFVKNEQDYYIAALIMIITSLGSSTINMWCSRSIVFSRTAGSLDLKRHIKPLTMVFGFSFITNIYINLDTVVLGLLSSIQSVGYYSTAMKLTKTMLALVVSFGGVLLPRLTWYIANDDRKEFDRLLKYSMAVVLLLCIPITTAIMFLSKEIVFVFAGSQYIHSVNCLVITSPIILFIGLTNIFGIQILYPLQREKKVLLSVGLGAIVSLSLNIILIPYFAQEGAAWSTLIAEISVLIIQIIFVKSYYKIHWPWNNISKYIFATAIMTTSFIITRILVPDDYLWLRLTIDIPLGISLYFTFLIVQKEEYTLDVLAKLKGRISHGRV